MMFGLEIAGFKKRLESYKESENLERFWIWYGPSPRICSKIWSDLQTTNVLCRVACDANPLHLLLALWFLKAHPAETELVEQFHKSNKTVHKLSAFSVKKFSYRGLIR